MRINAYYAPPPAQTSLLDEQLKFPRVRQARANVDANLRTEFESKGFEYPPKQILIRVLKTEKRVQVWAPKDGRMEVVKSYPIAISSGQLGPKVKAGDNQVPEGIYSIAAFNPQSSYHLALRVSYPNAADKARTGVLAPGANPGGDIMIHGSVVSVGCVPITDAKIEEVYWLAVLARSAGQASVPIHVLPCEMTPKNAALLENSDRDPQTKALWRELGAVDARFQADHQLPKVAIVDGHYSAQ